MAHVTRRDLARAAGLAGAGPATAAAAQPAGSGGPMPPPTPRVGTVPEVQRRDTTRGPAPQEQG